MFLTKSLENEETRPYYYGLRKLDHTYYYGLKKLDHTYCLRKLST